MSLKKLHDALSSISAGQKTGNLVFLIKEVSSKRVGIGTLAFDKGKLVRATFQQETGRNAISALLATDVPDMDFDVNFKEFPVTSEPDPGIPLIADLMQQMETRDQPKKSPNINLQNEVLQLLVSRFGASAVAKVDAIAQKISPTEQPVAFLDKCKSFVEMTSGKAKAEKIFAELYEKLKNQ